MVKKFRGKVKVADVQKEFDALVDKINELDARVLDVSERKEAIDWRYGSANLAPANFTLTVGGLKKALEGFDGAVYGARAFKTDSTHFKMTTGLLISKYGGFKLPDSVLSIPTSNRILYYNIFTSQYQWSPTGSGSIIIDNPFQAPTRILDVNETRTIDSGGNPIPVGVYCNIDNENGETVSCVGSSFGETNVLRYNNIEPQSQEDLDAGKIKLDIKDYFKIPLTIENSSKSVSFDYGERLSYSSDQGYYFAQKAKGSFIFGILERDATTFTPLYKVSLGGYNSCQLDSYIIDGLTQDSNSNEYWVDATLLGTWSNNQHIQPDGSYINKSSTAVQYDNPSGYDCTISYYEETQNNVVYPTLEIRNVLNSADGYVIYDNRIKISNYYASDFSSLTQPQINNIVTKARDLVPKINCVILDNGSFNIIDQDDVEQSDYLYNKANVMNPSYYYPEFMTTDGAFHYGEAEQVTDGVYKICEISPQRDSAYLNDLRNVQVEDLYGTYEVAVQNRIIIPLVNYGSYRSLAEPINNSSNPKFVCGLEDDQEAIEEDKSICYFQGREVSHNYQPFDRTMQSWYAMNYLYLPKGAANPYTYSSAKANATKVFNVIINKNIKG